MIRSITQIGALWPPCTSCRHIAQEHSEHGCSGRCECSGYKGMTLEEWRKLLTPEEIEHYKY